MSGILVNSVDFAFSGQSTLQNRWYSLGIIGVFEIPLFSRKYWFPLKFRKSAFCRNPRPFTKRLFFLGQMDGPEPWDRPNPEITRIPLNAFKIIISQEFPKFTRKYTFAPTCKNSSNSCRFYRFWSPFSAPDPPKPQIFGFSWNSPKYTKFHIISGNSLYFN